MPPASRYDEEPILSCLSSNNLESSLGVIVDSPSVNDNTIALDVNGDNCRRLSSEYEQLSRWRPRWRERELLSTRGNLQVIPNLTPPRSSSLQTFPCPWELGRGRGWKQEGTEKLTYASLTRISKLFLGSVKKKVNSTKIIPKNRTVTWHQSVLQYSDSYLKFELFDTNIDVFRLAFFRSHILIHWGLPWVHPWICFLCL